MNSKEKKESIVDTARELGLDKDPKMMTKMIFTEALFNQRDREREFKMSVYGDYTDILKGLHLLDVVSGCNHLKGDGLSIVRSDSENYCTICLRRFSESDLKDINFAYNRTIGRYIKGGKNNE